MATYKILITDNIAPQGIESLEKVPQIFSQAYN